MNHVFRLAIEALTSACAPKRERSSSTRSGVNTAREVRSKRVYLSLSGRLLLAWVRSEGKLVRYWRTPERWCLEDFVVSLELFFLLFSSATTREARKEVRLNLSEFSHIRGRTTDGSALALDERGQRIKSQQLLMAEPWWSWVCSGRVESQRVRHEVFLLDVVAMGN